MTVWLNPGNTPQEAGREVGGSERKAAQSILVHAQQRHCDISVWVSLGRI